MTITPASASGSCQPNQDPSELAALLKAAGDPLRLQILRVLNHNAFGALELADIFDMRQNALSHHLKLLSGVKLINSRREGTHIFYRRGNPRALQSLREAIFSAADQLALPRSIQQRIDVIQAARAMASQAFFKSNADKFREQQDLIASFPQYGDSVLATLDNQGSDKRQLALEVGAGEGELLPGLSQRFSQVVALDNAEEMLARARNHSQQANLDGIKFLLGDTRSPALSDVHADVITLNMVLHHTPVPASVIADLAQRLTANGVLLITELCQHDQDWARDACGDLWLGFEPEELNRWAHQAGLHNLGSEFLALKNGFTIQIQQYSRTPTRVN